MTDKLDALISKADALLDRIGQLVGEPLPEPDWSSRAYQWRRRGERAGLEPVRRPHSIALADLIGIERQKEAVRRNTEQFIAGYSANDVLLWGSRGTGKSSLIKALLHEFGDAGLRLVEVDKEHLTDLPAIVDRLADRQERFIVYCDDLSFDADQPQYKALKVVLDGSVSVTAGNVMICATSNRRHLMPELMADNAQTRHQGAEIHFGEAVEEKISLSERFGLWLSFHPFNQDQYLEIVAHWLAEFLPRQGTMTAATREEALRWALTRGSRSGRSARQFARDWAGRYQLEQ